ncbi:MAG: sensor histidine kinase, partial [Nocardioides sp.]|nr:sensor histidine kinase [Nocardioides sp.]
MALDRVPAGVWGWQPTLLLIAVTITPQLAVLQLVPRTRTFAEAAQVNDLLSYPLVLVAAMCLYVYWRLVGPDSANWLVAAAVLFAVQGLAFAGLRMANEADVRSNPGWLLIVEQVLALIVLAMVAQASRAPAPADPLALGLSLGLLFSGLRVFLSESAPQFALDPGLLATISLSILVTNLVTARLIIEVTQPPLWARQRLALAIVLLAFSHAITYPTPRGELRSLAAILANLAGAVLMAGTALVLLRVTIGEHRTWVASLNDRLAHVEAGLRVDRARLHEVGSTIAGISSASRLMHEVARVSPARRRKLEETIESEMARLER